MGTEGWSVQISAFSIETRVLPIHSFFLPTIKLFGMSPPLLFHFCFDTRNFFWKRLWLFCMITHNVKEQLRFTSVWIGYKYVIKINSYVNCDLHRLKALASHLNIYLTIFWAALLIQSFATLPALRLGIQGWGYKAWRNVDCPWEGPIAEGYSWQVCPQGEHPSNK